MFLWIREFGFKYVIAGEMSIESPMTSDAGSYLHEALKQAQINVKTIVKSVVLPAMN
jgi:hypothetical protein